MTLIVEDGSGVPGAEAYASAADCQAYWTDRGFVFAAFDTPTTEAAIRRATSVLEAAFATRWPGRAVNALGARQALAWPRQCARDLSGYEFQITEIPQELLSATAELASRELTAPYSLSPDMTTQRVLSESVAGAISVSYANMGDQRPVATVVNDILSALVRQANTGFLKRG